MDIKIVPDLLKGTVQAPPSKSAAHRAIICGMMATGTSLIQNIGSNDDIVATIDAARALGAKCTILQGKNGRRDLEIIGITALPSTAVIDCKESGSTLRFFVPIAAALGVETTFLGEGELPNRPMAALTSVMEKHGVSFYHKGLKQEIFTLKGTLEAGSFHLPGNISSQYITGLLFALSLLEKEREIFLSSPLESASYVDLTLEILHAFSVDIFTERDYFKIPSKQQVKAQKFIVEGDYSGAAFWLSAGALGSNITVSGLKQDTKQGDKHILEILKRFGAMVATEAAEVAVSVANRLASITIDATDIPDSVPILAVVATQAQGATRIINAERLRIKECDRLAAMTEGLSILGAIIEETADGLLIHGKTPLCGGTVSSYGDHRIAMALTIAATISTEPVIITGADSVSKSYPEFYEDFQSLGGVVDVLSLGE